MEEESPTSGRCEVGAAGRSDVELLDAYSRAVTTVVEAVGPAVVNISVGRESADGNGVEPMGAGSGILLTPDGYVLTNHHVVREANRVRLTLTDGDAPRRGPGRYGSAERPRGGPRGRLRASVRRAGRLRGPQGGAAGDRHRQSVRVPVERLHRRGERHGSRDAQHRPEAHRERDPAYRPPEPRQLRGAAGRFEGPGRRDQHGDHRGGAGARLRGAVEHGAPRGVADPRAREGAQGVPRDRRAAEAPVEADGAVLRTAAGVGGRGGFARPARAGGRLRNPAGRHRGRDERPPGRERRRPSPPVVGGGDRGTGADRRAARNGADGRGGGDRRGGGLRPGKALRLAGGRFTPSRSTSAARTAGCRRGGSSAPRRACRSAPAPGTSVRPPRRKRAPSPASGA